MPTELHQLLALCGAVAQTLHESFRKGVAQDYQLRHFEAPRSASSEPCGL